MLGKVVDKQALYRVQEEAAQQNVSATMLACMDTRNGGSGDGRACAARAKANFEDIMGKSVGSSAFAAMLKEVPNKPTPP